MVPENIRIRFRKTGSLKYISHLDLCRTMCPAMIRGKIPLWYTEGFNPHPKMVFTQPLPLFVESYCEFLDIKIVETLPLDELRDRLRSAFTDELYVEEVYVPARKFSDIAYAEYEITGIDALPKNALSGELLVTKHGKNGDKEVDIRPQIHSLEFRDGKLYAVLAASGASYLNPDLLCRALGASDYSIIRLRWFDEKLTEFR